MYTLAQLFERFWQGPNNCAGVYTSRIDYLHKRIKKDSFEWYRRVCKANGACLEGG